MLNNKYNMECQILVCGATFLGLGIAYANSKNCIVIERTSSVGREFVNSYNAGNSWETKLNSAASKKLKEELIRRNLLKDGGKVHFGGIAPVLFNLIKEEKLQFLFNTDIIEVNKNDDFFEVTIYNASGIQKIKTKEIVNTSANKLTCLDENVDIKTKRINALLNYDSTECTKATKQFESEEYSIIPGLFDTEAVLKLNLSTYDDWPVARKKMHNFWERTNNQYPNWKIAWMADEFEVKIHVNEKADKYTWLPSCNSANFLKAFDAGYELGSQLGLKLGVRM